METLEKPKEKTPAEKLQEQIKDHTRSRALDSDRPRFRKQCREGLASQKKTCREQGHNYQFLLYDRYGCCNRCGAEVLT